MHAPPYSHLDRGTLMVASPDIDAGFYFRSVMLICEHSSVGSFCLIVNKPIELQLPEDILNPKEIVNPDVQLRAGGPIQQSQMIMLHSSDKNGEHSLKVCEGVYLGGDLQFLQESSMNPHGPHLRLCFGYSGWGAGQLEREFLSGNWFLHPASTRHIFEVPPEKLWQNVLREMGGKYTTLSMIPEDLSLN